MSTVGNAPAAARGHARAELSRRVLLACGIAYGAVYVVSNDVVAASAYPGFSRRDQVVSELSAVGASPRPFLIAMLFLYTVLLVGFGIGVWQSASGSRALRVTGGTLVAFGVTGVLWLPFPMSPRTAMVGASSMSTNDIGHLVLSGVTAALITTMVIAGAVHYGPWFRAYSAATLLCVFTFTGALTAIESAKMAAGDPTPWLGVYERVGLGAYMLWMAVLAVLLLYRPGHRRHPGPPHAQPPFRRTPQSALRTDAPAGSARDTRSGAKAPAHSRRARVAMSPHNDRDDGPAEGCTAGKEQR